MTQKLVPPPKPEELRSAILLLARSLNELQRATEDALNNIRDSARIGRAPEFQSIDSYLYKSRSSLREAIDLLVKDQQIDG